MGKAVLAIKTARMAKAVARRGKGIWSDATQQKDALAVFRAMKKFAPKQYQAIKDALMSKKSVGKASKSLEGRIEAIPGFGYEPSALVGHGKRLAKRNLLPATVAGRVASDKEK